ncbi:KR domain-containing protein, partial [Actinoplanes missouriensis]|uniref:type I polyketide synthase n=1 Tax=Actinoplanes missouriensis TaxID=1866 RepID=UPI0033EBECFD
AADGRCRSFAAQASGTVWAEGVGLLLVERLSRARTHGHPVLAVLRGSAINQDGASNGLTAPSGTAQRLLLHEALQTAGLSPADVDAVEGHGTGTPLGDPVELSALADVYGSTPRTQPVWLGSLKSNLGHAQAAAGVAGVIKMILALQHERVPATLHAQEPSPAVDWDAGTLTLVTEPVPWPASPQHVRRAGISSFGISGTNAHVIIEEPPTAPAPTPGPAVMPLLLSARTATGLRDQARRLHQHLTTSDTDLDDIAHTLATGRDHFTHRATILRDGNEHATLTALARGTGDATVLTGVAEDQPRIVYACAFPANGPAEAVASPVFDAERRRMSDAFAAHPDVPPATVESFALLVAAAAFWRASGVESDAVVGIGAAEPAAAYLAGVLTLDDAVRLTATAGSVSPVTVSAPAVDYYSTAAGTELRAGDFTPEHWRRAFTRTGGALAAPLAGAGHLVLDLGGGAPGADAVALRSGAGRALAQAYVRGATVTTGALATNRPAVVLPTYPFDRRRYWMTAPARSGAGDPFGATTMALASGGLAVTAALSHRDVPWLAEHVVAGRAVVPGTALLELALSAGRAAGTPVVADMVVEAPVTVSPDEEAELQLAVEPGDGIGRRPFVLYSRPAPAGPDDPWTRHAAGTFAPEPADATAPASAARPLTAVPLPVDDLYGELAATGYEYGPTFRGVRAAWTGDGDTYLELTLPDGVGVSGYGTHPALLDAALHLTVRDLAAADGATWVPFAWTGVRQFPRRPGDSRTQVRVRVVPAGAGVIGLSITDTDGNAVAEVDRLELRPLPADVTHDALFTVAWRTAEFGSAQPAEPSGWAVIPMESGNLDEVAAVPPAALVMLCPPAPEPFVPGAVHDLLHETLTVLQAWLTDERFTATRLVVATRHAVAVGDVPPDPAHAALWGLVRSAQTEEPGRIVLVDRDHADLTDDILATILGGDEPEVAVRDGVLSVPRLVRAVTRPGAGAGLDPDGTVLVTGGTGALAAEVVVHLVTAYRVRNLLLLSRRGPQAPHAARLQAELAALGAHAEVVACDVADRDALAAVIDGIPADRPLTAVLHLAGTVADATLGTLGAQQLASVLPAKVDAAWHLHELTRDRPLGAFLMFSSASATLGFAGQGAYAAGNAFLEALAIRRTRAGLPAQALGWGAWESSEGMAGRMAERDRHRLVRDGLRLIGTGEGPLLLDRAVTVPAAVVLPAPLDMAAVRAQARPRPLFRALLPARASGAASDTTGWQRIAGMPAAERTNAIRDLVLAVVAEVLGYQDGSGFGAGSAFRDLGFDSLMLVELRSRLAAATGLSLPSSMLFDYPTPAAVAEFLDAGESPEDHAPLPLPDPELPATDDDPIVVVSMGCRLPGGVSTPEDLWDVVAAGRDVITDFPQDRGWDPGLVDPVPGVPGRTYVGQG